MSSAQRIPVPGLQPYAMREQHSFGWLQSSYNALRDKVQRKKQFSSARLNSMAQRVLVDEAELSQLSPEDFTERTLLVRQAMLKHGPSEEVICQVFGLVREAAWRTLGMRHYAEQLIGGWIMFNGMVAEMETGQGKSLTATLAAVAAAYSGAPTHIITVNEYLASRDADFMAPLYELLGVSVSFVDSDMSLEEKQQAYSADITYCTNKQIAFDHLRDRMVMGSSGQAHLRLENFYRREPRRTQLMLPGLCFAIVDEADSVLVDEAVTPLIISRNLPMTEKADAYQLALTLAGNLVIDEHYSIHPQLELIDLKVAGKDRLTELSQRLGGIWIDEMIREDLVLNALRALNLYNRDVEYLVVDGKVQIVDEFTGRVMADRSWEKGLHQMIELKEGCELTPDREVIARISYQRFFKRYARLAGMTGTAKEIQRELAAVYDLHVHRIPPAQTVRRTFLNGKMCADQDAKWLLVLERIKAIHATGRPILVGTRSVEASESLSALLRGEGLEHQLLNARQDFEEAEVVAAAGQFGHITVATNMAGRGTDIKLSEQVVELGGLHVMVTERHESRRIDRQLFGRCARQGDPGSVEIIEAVDDEVLRRNCPGFLRKSLVNAADSSATTRLIITLAQLVVERRQYNARRNVMKSDDYFATALSFTGQME
ncbi:MAG: hypothetical protein V7720_09140 [Halioglobus sp.]